MTLQPDLFGTGSEEETTVLFVDTETTGTDTGTAEVCEIGMVLARYSGFTPLETGGEVFSALVKPSADIPPEASAVHHITNRMVASSPALSELEKEISRPVAEADYICAHNLPYDLAILVRQLPDVFGRFSAGMGIDTLRLARHVWPEIPSHSLQALRYRFDLDAAMDGDAHRAVFDAGLVKSLLESILRENILECTDWIRLVEYIRSPLQVLVFSFGKYRGSLVEDIVVQDSEYVGWLLRQPWIPDEYPDLYHTLLRKTGKSPGKERK
jgi:exodeoxyribonuclease X